MQSNLGQFQNGLSQLSLRLIVNLTQTGSLLIKFFKTGNHQRYDDVLCYRLCPYANELIVKDNNLNGILFSTGRTETTNTMMAYFTIDI